MGPRVVAHFYKPSTWEAEAGGSQVWRQPGLHSKFKLGYKILSQKKEKVKVHGILNLWNTFDFVSYLALRISVKKTKFLKHSMKNSFILETNLDFFFFKVF